ncbi:protein ROOT HAIR DEFECTIVE 3-like [Zingiber officinale]|uniref:protein ROOT HAIR DEFECTIVE 3-like n=1 Tax=Zingiber officinale TaxID=94328 RepID=UPI001C4B7B42|nr:protein ROOT HAIR DEFECTIVE 3-like [Zingiber officinale]
MDVGCCCIELIDRDGVFNHSAMKYFMRATNMDKGGLDYAVVSMLGKKQSGKSTLLNHLFGTDLYEINHLKERPLTTKGIWLAKCTNINTFTVVLDMQGADKKDSRQDGSELEKQRITFALAVSDIVLINMWCHDIISTQELATDQCLLKTVFEIRDSILKPYQKLNDFFRIEVVALASYKENKKLFKEQVAILRKLYPYIPLGRLDAVGNNSYPASEFSIGTQEIWNDIKDNKELNLILHREWLEIKRNMRNNEMVPGLIEKLFMIFDKYLTLYDRRACFFRQDIRELKRNGLQCKLNQTTNYQSNERGKKVCRHWAIMALGLLGFNEMMTLFRFFQYHYYIALITFAVLLYNTLSD